MFDSIKNSFTTNKKNILISIAVIIIFGIIGYTIYIYTRPKLLTQLNGDEPTKTSDSDAELIFFFANWCPHCKEAKPQWEEIKKEYNGKTVNGYNIIFTEIDCSNESDEVKQFTKQYDIEGYPTIKLVKDEQIIDYDAKPDKSTIEKFINTMV